MSAVPSLLSAAVRNLSRSAHGVVVSPTRGFQVFRIDGYSWAKTIPAGMRITSGLFTVGGRKWLIDYYPNGIGTDDVARDTDSISLYLRLAAGSGYEKERVQAHYKFSVLDHSGVAAYELPPVMGIFTSDGRVYGHHVHGDAETGNNVGVGLAVSKEELERRSETLLKDDCLAIRCDVGVTELAVLAIEPKERHNNKQQDSDSDWEDGATHESRRRHRQPLDDREYIRRCLAKNRRT